LKTLFLPVLLAVAATAPLPAVAGELVLKNGDKVAFLGDSITDLGWSRPHGYVRLVEAGLAANGVTITPIPAGVSGNTSTNMLARLKRDVLDKKPDWVTISCGMNDVVPVKGVPLDQFRTNMADMVGQCRSDGIKVILFTTTTGRQHLDEYSGALRDLAKASNCPLVDLHPVFTEAGKHTAPLHPLTYDGVHMNAEGNLLLASTILRDLGCDDVQLAKARERWLDMPDAGQVEGQVVVKSRRTFFVAKCGLTLRQRERLISLAQSAGKTSLTQWANELLESIVKRNVKPEGTYDSVDALFDPQVRAQLQPVWQKEFEQEVRKAADGTASVPPPTTRSAS